MRRAEGGAQAYGIGRSRGGLTTKIHAAVDALGLPVRLIPTAGQRGDSPQAAALIDGLDGVGHVIADAACESDTLRGKIRDDLRAEAHIQANPSRAIMPPLDPDLHAERHKVENFLQRITRFRPIALRREETRTSFMGIVFLVSARDWLRGMQTGPRAVRWRRRFFFVPAAIPLYRSRLCAHHISYGLGPFPHVLEQAPKPMGPLRLMAQRI